MKKLLFRIFPISIVILTVFSVQQWLRITVTSTFISWVLDFFIIFIVLKFRYHVKGRIKRFVPVFDLWVLEIYFIWLIISCIRGAFIAEDYWEWKQLVSGMLSLSLPLYVYVFSISVLQKRVLHIWFKYALILFLLLLPFLSRGAYHFYLGPVFLAGCFIPILPKKWRFIIGGLLLIMLVIDLGARSQVIKAAMVLLVALGVYFRRFLTWRIIKIAHWSCYILPVVLLALGLSGTFNIFEDLSSNSGKYVQKRMVDGEMKEDDLAADTRTFIYVEVIESALRHHYVLWGRTPARGNDSVAFGSYNADELKTGKYERHANELCHTNVFTWLGLVGLVLYSLIYLRSSYLAVYKSNNIYIKLIGCFIAFRWAYGWVEDFNRFDIMNLSLWMLIAMGLSFRFRLMTNHQFKAWVNSIFQKNNSHARTLAIHQQRIIP